MRSWRLTPTSSSCSLTGLTSQGLAVAARWRGWARKRNGNWCTGSERLSLARTGPVAWGPSRAVLRCLEGLEKSMHSTDEAHTPSDIQPNVCIPFFYFYSLLDKASPHLAQFFLLSFVNIRSDIHRVSGTFLLPCCHGTRCLSSCQPQQCQSGGTVPVPASAKTGGVLRLGSILWQVFFPDFVFLEQF